MKKIFLLLIFILSVGMEIEASTRITATITVTNAPTTNGSSFEYNGDVRTGTNALSATTWVTNATIGGTASNIFTHLLYAPPTGPVRISRNGTNAVNIVAPIDGAVSISLVGDWAEVSYSTQTVAGVMRPISVPASNYLSQAQATNDYSNFSRDYNTYATNWIGFTSNGVNYGTAFSSPGSGTLSEQFGSSADADGERSVAIGVAASAVGDNTIAIGRNANANGDGDSAIGRDAAASSGGSSSFGFAATAGSESDGNATAIGAGATAIYQNSTAIGYGSTTTASNQVMLGTATVSTYVNSQLTIGGYIVNPSAPFTNNTSQAAGDNSGVVIGEHENVLLSGMGASAFSTAGIVSGRDGRTVTLWNTNGASWTIPNNSGLDATPANRIITGTAGTLTITNNPGSATFIYNTNVSRWWVKSHSN